MLNIGPDVSVLALIVDPFFCVVKVPSGIQTGLWSLASERRFAV